MKGVHDIEITREDLPEGILADLADGHSMAEALRLARTWGGQKIYIPKRRPRINYYPLEWECLIPIYQGALVYVPTLSSLRQRAVRRQVIAEVRGGASARATARRYGLSSRAVESMVGRESPK